MSRNKYGLPTKKTKLARGHRYADGGLAEADEPEWKRIAREDQARRDAYDAEPVVAPKTKPAVKEDTSTIGQLKAHKAKLERLMSGDDSDTPVKKAGGVVKSRGNGCAIKGHGKGRFR